MVDRDSSSVFGIITGVAKQQTEQVSNNGNRNYDVYIYYLKKMYTFIPFRQVHKGCELEERKSSPCPFAWKYYPWGTLKPLAYMEGADLRREPPQGEARCRV